MEISVQSAFLDFSYTIKNPVSDWAFSYLLSGEGRIRTDGALADTLVFKTRAINHSTTSPRRFYILSSSQLEAIQMSFVLT